MKVRYDKLWILMKDNKMTKSELAQAAELTTYAMTKLNNEKKVDIQSILKLCKVFHCDIVDLIEVIEKEKKGG